MEDHNFIHEGITTIIGGVVAIIGFVSKRAVSKVDKLDESHSELKLKVAEQYVTKSYMEGHEAKTLHALERIHDRLDDIYNQRNGTADDKRRET
jgi:hypothetical protein